MQPNEKDHLAALEALAGKVRVHIRISKRIGELQDLSERSKEDEDAVGDLFDDLLDSERELSDALMQVDSTEARVERGRG